MENLREQLTTKYMQKIYDTVTVGYGQKPIIVDADDLQENPGRILAQLVALCQNSTHQNLIFQRLHLLIQELLILHRCLHYDTCVIQIDWFFNIRE